MTNFKYKITKYEDKYYVCKFHPCGIWEAIFWGTLEECILYKKELETGQLSLCFEDFSAAEEKDIDPILDDFEN